MKGRLIGAATLVALLWSAMVAAGTYALKIEGMACPACAERIERQLGKLEEVENAQVEYESGKGVVQIKTGMTLTEEKAREVMNGAGFELSGEVVQLERTP
jgi:copper chaperone CopZ